MKGLVAVLDKKKSDAVEAVLKMLRVLNWKKADSYIIAAQNNVESLISLKKPNAAIAQAAAGMIFRKITANDKPMHYRLGNAVLIIDGRAYPPMENGFTVDHGKTPCEVAEKLLLEKDGCFAFAAAEKDRIFYGRDPLGVHPLYYGENEEFFAIASERKALWCIGIKEAETCPTGSVVAASGHGLTVKAVKNLRDPGIKPLSIDEAVSRLERLLMQAVMERSCDVREAAVAFSGGLDSSLTALMLKKMGVEARLIHVSLEGQPEIRQAEEAAEMLNMSIHMQIYQEGDVEEVLPEVLWAAEDPEPLNASIGVPLYWTAKAAADLNCKVLFAGQGADELFGGYSRYVEVYNQFGSEAARKTMLEDVLRMHEVNFERDYKLCSHHGVELRLPFADYDLAMFALGLPVEFKIGDRWEKRKILLRRTALKLGLPSEIVHRPKKAIQYATGVDKAIKKLAKKHRQPLRTHLQKLFSERLSKFLTDIEGM